MKQHAALLILQLAICGQASANACPDAATGSVLAVKGLSRISGESVTVSYSKDKLSSLVRHHAVMELPLQKETAEFDGPLLGDVIKDAGIAGKMISIQALNNHAAKLPLENANSFSAIVSMKIGSENFALRKEGPMFLLHPFESKEDENNEKFISYSIWKICEIEVY